MTDDTPYKGYLVRLNPFDGLYRVSRDGFHIATATTPDEARNIIDGLTPAPDGLAKLHAKGYL